MKEFFKKMFELQIRMLWLKSIHKEVDKRNRFYEKYQRSKHVISELVKEYQSRYGDSFTSKSEVSENEEKHTRSEE